MRKIAVVQLTLAVAMVAASLGVVPGADAKKRKEDGGDVMTTDENNGNNDVRQTADNDDNNNDNNNNNNNNNNIRATAGEYDDKRFAAVRYDELQPAAESGGPTSAQQAKAVAKQSSKQHNAKLLNRLGMKRIRTGGSGSAAGGTGSGANHHRKRLASQSRSKYGNGGAGGADSKSTSDSQMFIVKLPPHSHFYDDGSPAAATHQRPSSQQSHHNNNNNNNNKMSPYKSLNTVPVGFVSNGKPAKVYHWNLPTIKHALQGGGGRYKGVNDVVAMQQQQHHHHHHQQQQQQQQHQQMHHHQLQQQYNQAMQDFELPSVAAGSKIVPRRTLYYKPRASGKPVKKSFVNNGKPNGFYVVSSKNAAAAPQYHKIVKAYYGSGDD